jgi:hypothetical protein
MNISSKEAYSIIDAWRVASTPLLVHLAGREGDFQATVVAIEGTVVGLVCGNESLKMDLAGADFNGDGRPTGPNRGAYLVCEFRNGDRCSFYAQRPFNP